MSGSTNLPPPTAPTPQETTAIQRDESEAQASIIAAAKLYAGKVALHAGQGTHQTLFPGQNYEAFAAFLRRCFASSRLDNTTWMSRRGRSFATIYELAMSRQLITEIRNAYQCARLLEAGQESMLLFLKGYPSPEWLASVGSICGVDPEYFLRHLNFQSHRDYYALPSLPSSNENIIKLRITTLGYRQPSDMPKGMPESEFLKDLRRKASSEMERYLQDLLIGRDRQTGDSIVRRYSIHSPTLFSIEQEISVCVTNIGRISTDERWLAVVWSDAGHDLASSPGPWLGSFERHRWRTELFPTIQSNSKVALNSSEFNVPRDDRNNRTFPQSASLLAEEYGRLLDARTMSCDPFYAMNELFKFAASSESQFLNMTEAVLSPDTGFKVLDQGVLTLANLLYHQEILEAHAVSLREQVDVIKQRGCLDWKRTSTADHLVKSETAAAQLLKDYESLLSRAEYLLRRCENGMKVIMNNATIDQAQKAREQEKGIASAATKLAFFYIPLSFMTGVYGMNFKEFGTGKMTIGIFFGTAIPVLILSIVCLYFDVRKGLVGTLHRLNIFVTDRLPS